jgi:hypothetical protein
MSTPTSSTTRRDAGSQATAKLFESTHARKDSECLVSNTKDLDKSLAAETTKSESIATELKRVHEIEARRIENEKQLIAKESQRIDANNKASEATNLALQLLKQNYEDNKAQEEEAFCRQNEEKDNIIKNLRAKLEHRK